MQEGWDFSFISRATSAYRNRRHRQISSTCAARLGLRNLHLQAAGQCSWSRQMRTCRAYYLPTWPRSDTRPSHLRNLQGLQNFLS